MTHSEAIRVAGVAKRPEISIHHEFEMERFSQNDGFTADGMEFTGRLARKTRNKNS